MKEGLVFTVVSQVLPEPYDGNSSRVVVSKVLLCQQSSVWVLSPVLHWSVDLINDSGPWIG